jgi:anti-anti-sigma regulatory factor
MLGIITSDQYTPSAPARISVCGELTVENRQRLREQLMAALADGHTYIVVDLAECQHACPAALGVLAGVQRLLRDIGRRLTLANPTADMRTVLDGFTIVRGVSW